MCMMSLPTYMYSLLLIFKVFEISGVFCQVHFVFLNLLLQIAFLILQKEGCVLIVVLHKV